MARLFSPSVKIRSSEKEATIKSHPALAMATISRILVKVPKKPWEGAPQFPEEKKREKEIPSPFYDFCHNPFSPWL